MARHGAGTERVEHELSEALGDDGFPVFRLDAEAAARKDALARTLARFEAAPAGVLVGTQMVAKGHDFAGVSLGVVLDADQTLRFPDFRAEERTFALITQLAGRAGRGSDSGSVLVQTLAPSARSIAFASRHDSEGVHRRRARPPRAPALPAVRVADPGGVLGRAAGATRQGWPPSCTVDRGAGATVLGPAPLFRLRGRSRSQLLLKSTERLAAIDAVGAAVEAVGPGAPRAGSTSASTSTRSRTA